MSRKCKICRSGHSEMLSFARYYLEWDWKKIQKVYSLNLYEFSTQALWYHFRHHVHPANIQYWVLLRKQHIIQGRYPALSEFDYLRGKNASSL